MIRPLLALLVCCFVGLYTVLPSAAAGEYPVTFASVFVEVGAGSSDVADVQVSPDAATKCHDVCNWLAAWHVPVMREARRSPAEDRIRTLPPAFISSVTPPPR